MHFACIDSCIPHNNPWSRFYFILIVRGGNRGPEKLRKLPETPQLMNLGWGLNQAVWLQSLWSRYLSEFTSLDVPLIAASRIYAAHPEQLQKEAPPGRGWLERPGCSGELYLETLFPGSSQGCFTDPHPLSTSTCCVSLTSLKMKPAHPEKQCLPTKLKSGDTRWGGLCGWLSYCSCCQRLRLHFQHCVLCKVLPLTLPEAWARPGPVTLASVHSLPEVCYSTPAGPTLRLNAGNLCSWDRASAQKGSCLVECPAVSILKFYIVFEWEACAFSLHWVLQIT